MNVFVTMCFYLGSHYHKGRRGWTCSYLAVGIFRVRSLSLFGLVIDLQATLI